MNIKIKQMSSLEKLTSRNFDALDKIPELKELTVIRGERASYQIALYAEDFRLHARIWAESDPELPVKLFHAAEAAVDNPTESRVTDENYILNEPGLLSDILVPIEAPSNRLFIYRHTVFVWVRLDIPKELPAGKYTVCVNFGFEKDGDISDSFILKHTQALTLNVVDAVMPKPTVKYTRWIYLDCIADAHNVRIFSEEHWSLIEKYIAAASDVGINMLLVPIHTPPLDTEVGTARPCVQLVDIEKNGDKYSFGFEKLRRYISLCKKYGIEYFEMAHMFSQWGAECAPNIEVCVNGEKKYLFGWHTRADDREYIDFLGQYIPAVYKQLEAEGVAENTYFHISDEPHSDQIEKYKNALEIFKPLVGRARIFDALSDIAFYKEGIVKCPVTSVKAIHEFLQYGIDDQWLYYCCHPERVFPNSFIAMPSARIRILGVLIYKYNIKGFLHWGLNYYNAPRSKYKINPYITTSADGGFSSGDAFILYPAQNTVYGSTRGEVLYQAMQDIAICQALEAFVGHERVVRIIDGIAGRDIRFDDYPCDNLFFEALRAAVTDELCTFEANGGR